MEAKFNVIYMNEAVKFLESLDEKARNKMFISNRGGHQAGS